MTPPTVNAYYDPSMNNINFPAGILQPAFYDPKADLATNYGHIGGVIGHELTHGFDDEGAKFDGKGNLDDWWTTADKKNFETRTQCLEKQYDGFVAVDDVHVNGKLTLGENTADNGGLLLAYLAYLDRAKQDGVDTNAKLDGYTGPQRFYIAWAQNWCENARPEMVRRLVLPLLLTHRPRLGAGEWGWLLFGTFLGIPVQFLLQFRGLSLTTVSHASLMVGSMPVLLAVGATVFLGERLDGLGWAALAVSTAGAALIALGGHHGNLANGPSLAGDLLVVVSMVIALFWILINQHLIARHSPVMVSAYGILAGFFMLLVCVPLLYGWPPVQGISVKAWLALAGSGLLCTASTTLLWNWGMTRVPASQAGVLLNIEPLIGSVLGVAVLGEHLGSSAFVGGAMIVVAAVALTTRSSRAATEVRGDPTTV